MRLLLDTHALLWWFEGDPGLSSAARHHIGAAGKVLVSVASAWELAIKNKSGKLRIGNLVERLPAEIDQEGFDVLHISLSHAVRAGSLIEHHRDPFDRMLVAQAQAENLAIVSRDRIFERYGIDRIW